MTNKKEINQHGKDLVGLIYQTLDYHSSTIQNIAETIISCLKDKNKVIIFGNGGSYADALHFAAELEGTYRNRNRPGLSALVPSNVSSLTAIANDFSYEDIFRRFVQASGKEGDIVIGISTSGNSKNVIKAMEYARKNKMKTIAFTGYSGGKMKDEADILLNILSEDTPRVQELHHFAYHEICDIVEREMFKQ